MTLSVVHKYSNPDSVSFFSARHDDFEVRPYKSRFLRGRYVLNVIWIRPDLSPEKRA
jgi:hypothetical protein